MKIVVARGWGEGGMTRWSKEDFLGSETILNDTVTVDTGHHILVKTQECTTPRVNLNANYGPKMIMTCQCRFHRL